MRYSKAGLGITVQMLFQFISYFGSFNLSRGKKPNEEISYFLSRTQHKNKAVWTQSKSTQLQAARWLQGCFVGSPALGQEGTDPFGGRGPFWRTFPCPKPIAPLSAAGSGCGTFCPGASRGFFTWRRTRRPFSFPHTVSSVRPWMHYGPLEL